MATANQVLLQSAIDKATAALNRLYDQPRPDGGVDGANWQYTAMRKSLIEEIHGLRVQMQEEDGAFEVQTFPSSDLG